MAAYYVTCKGSSHGYIHRIGGKDSGVRATLAGWSGSVKVHLRDVNGTSWVTVRLDTWEGAGIERLIYDGPVDAQGTKATARKRRK